jgi:hypothetical protein
MGRPRDSRGRGFGRDDTVSNSLIVNLASPYESGDAVDVRGAVHWGGWIGTGAGALVAVGVLGWRMIKRRSRYTPQHSDGRSRNTGWPGIVVSVQQWFLGRGPGGTVRVRQRTPYLMAPYAPPEQYPEVIKALLDHDKAIETATYKGTAPPIRVEATIEETRELPAVPQETSEPRDVAAKVIVLKPPTGQGPAADDAAKRRPAFRRSRRKPNPDAIELPLDDFNP